MVSEAELKVKGKVSCGQNLPALAVLRPENK